MKKLENIPKKEIFSVPEGYFEALPEKIQSRISKENRSGERGFVLRYKLHYVLPVATLLAISIYWFTGNNPKHSDVDSILASVKTEDLVAYLRESDITTEDLLENIELNSSELEAIESEVYEFNIDTEEDLNQILEDIDLENI